MEINFNNLHNTQAEREVLNAILFNPYIYDYVADIISRDIFQDTECQKVYDMMQQMIKAGKTIDAAEVFTIMRKEGLDFSHFVMENIAASELTRQRVAFLDDLYTRRKLLNLCYKAEAMVTDTTISREELRSVSKDFDGYLNNDSQEDECQQIGDVIGSLMNDVAERMADKGERGIMTGLNIFDSRFGWHRGDLVIVAGATSQGKSTLASTIMFNMAMAGVPVADYSLEMSAKQVTARMMARLTQVSSSTTLYGKLSDQEYKQVYDGSLSMKKLPIYFDEKNKTSFVNMCSSIRRMVKRYGVKVVFIDYLQILANGSRDNRESLIGDMARDLKRLAVEENICVCALSQLSRPKDEKGRPRLNQMRGSGQIEEACDMAVLIHRPNLQKESANIYLDKGRNIGVAKDIIKFNGNISYFSDFEQGDPSAPYKEQKEDLPF